MRQQTQSYLRRNEGPGLLGPSKCPTAGPRELSPSLLSPVSTQTPTATSSAQLRVSPASLSCQAQLKLPGTASRSRMPKGDLRLKYPPQGRPNCEKHLPYPAGLESQPKQIPHAHAKNHGHKCTMRLCLLEKGTYTFVQLSSFSHIYSVNNM
jgi:hypothetical protein